MVITLVYYLERLPYHTLYSEVLCGFARCCQRHLHNSDIFKIYI